MLAPGHMKLQRDRRGARGWNRGPERLGLATLALALLMAAVPATSAEAAQWLPPADISDSFSENGRQEVATNASGAAQVVWVRDEGGSDRALTRRVGADGTLGPVMSLDASSSLGGPHVSMDPAGNAIVVWSNSATINFLMLDANGDPTGPATPLSTAANGEPSVILDQDGNATVVWPEVANSPTFGSALFYSRIPAGGPPSAKAQFFVIPFTSAFSVFRGSPPVAMGVDSDGVVTAGWIDMLVNTGFPSNVRVRHLDPDGTLGPVLDLDAFSTAFERIQLGVDSSGDAVALWKNNEMNLWRAQQISADDMLGTLHDISDPAATSLGGGAISVQPDGSAPIGWEETVAGNTATNVQRLAANDTLGPMQVLRTDTAGEVTSALMPGGGTAFAWNRSDGTFSRVESRRLDSGDNLSPIDMGLSDDSSDAAELMAAGTSTGPPSLIWRRDDPVSGTTIQLTSFDSMPPLITSIAGPANGSTGQQLVFAASATDRSGIAGFNWSFGDGGAANGPIVQHSYAGPGTFPVTLTVTDNSGNQSVSQLSVTVTTGGGGGALSPFTVGGLDGRDLLVNVPSAGTVNVSNAGAQGASSAAVTARKKKRGKRKLRPSSATGGPGIVRVRLRLTRAAKRKLKRRGKLGVGAVVAFTPNGGATNSQVSRLRLRGG